MLQGRERVSIAHSLPSLESDVLTHVSLTSEWGGEYISGAIFLIDIVKITWVA